MGMGMCVCVCAVTVTTMQHNITHTGLDERKTGRARKQNLQIFVFFCVKSHSKLCLLSILPDDVNLVYRGGANLVYIFSSKLSLHLQNSMGKVQESCTQIMA